MSATSGVNGPARTQPRFSSSSRYPPSPRTGPSLSLSRMLFFFMGCPFSIVNVFVLSFDCLSHRKTVWTESGNVYSFSSSIQHQLRHHNADGGRDFETHPGKTGADIQTTYSRDLPQERTGVRRHVVHPRNAAHYFGMGQLRDTPGGPLNHLFQACIGRALWEAVGVDWT